MCQPRLCNIHSYNVDVGPVQVLKRRLDNKWLSTSRRDIPAMIEAIEHSDRIRDIPIDASACITDSTRYVRGAGHLGERRHDGWVRRERICLIKPLPAREPQQF